MKFLPLQSVRRTPLLPSWRFLGSAILCAASCLLLACSGSAQTSTLNVSISQVTSTSFQISWTTGSALNGQVHYGVSALSASLYNWKLSTTHSFTVTGLTPGTAYQVQAESSYYTSTDLRSSILTVTTPSSSTTSGGSTGGGTTPTGATGTGTLPVASFTTSPSSITLTWMTSQPLNTQVAFGQNGLTQHLYSWSLTTSHSVTITGLQSATPYFVQIQSAYYSNPDLVGPVQTISTAAAISSGGTGTTGGGTGTSSSTALAPATIAVSGANVTVSWTTSQPLNSQVSYGIGNLQQNAYNWSLTTNHQVVLSNLAAGTYELQAQSSYYTTTDLLGPVQTFTVTATPSGSSTSNTARLFPGSGADWLYSAPTGTGIDISSQVSGSTFTLDTHDGGFDYPVQYTDGTHGCTTFTDTLVYSFKDKICVPNPANGYWPSVGGWGSNDGHLVVVDTSTNQYYDFWKLYTDGNGNPTSTNVGKIVSGSLNGNGTPGTTAAGITGLAGDIMPGELDCTTCLNHALNIIVPDTMNSPIWGTQAPMTGDDGTVTGGLYREGAKIRFDPSVNIDLLPASTAIKAIMRALQLYGGVITDQGGGTGPRAYTDLPVKPDMTGANLITQHLLIYY